MKSEVKTLGAMLGASQTQYVIPVYQRNYRWGEHEWTRLWCDLKKVENAPEGKCHFMGFLVSDLFDYGAGAGNRYYLVDGQQRLSTSSILLVALMKAAEKAGDSTLAKKIKEGFLVHHLEKGDAHYRVLPKDRERPKYLEMIKGEAPKGAMGEALTFFTDKIKNHTGGDSEKLNRLFGTICDRLEFISVTLNRDSGENAYEIFKSMNSTGVRLGESDLIRNFVFMNIPPEAGRHDLFDKEKWQPLENLFVVRGAFDGRRMSQFFRDFLMAGKKKYVSPKRVFETFEADYGGGKISETKGMDKITEYARHYAVIFGAAKDGSNKVNLSLSGLNDLKSPTTYPLLLALFAQRAEGKIDGAQLAQCIDMLRGFMFRRYICGESSRGYGQLFVRALEKIAEPVQGLEQFLLEQVWPDDGEFKEKILRFPLYKKGYGKVVLVGIEKARGHSEPANPDGIDVEHIMPQKLTSKWETALGAKAKEVHKAWRHCLGNLTLSGENRKLSNKPFEDKRAEFKDSHFTITKEVAQLPQWDADEIISRGKQLAEEAARIWIGPKE